MSERPYWYPELTDAVWLARIREDYPEHADWEDDSLRDHYADGWKYADTWDHLGDAREEYEKLADAYLALQAAGERVTAAFRAMGVARQTIDHMRCQQECESAMLALDAALAPATPTPSAGAKSG